MIGAQCAGKESSGSDDGGRLGRDRWQLSIGFRKQRGEGIAEAYKVTTLPVVYVIGTDGKVICCHQGVDDKNLSSVIEKHFKAIRIVKAN